MIRHRLSKEARLKLARIFVSEIQAALKQEKEPYSFQIHCADGSRPVIHIPVMRCLKEHEAVPIEQPVPVHVNGEVLTETTPTEDLILGALREAIEPKKLVAIAAKVDHKNDAHFAKAMRRLVWKGIVKKMPENRYWLAEKSIPPL